jgi:hypothetical protein
MVEAEDFSNYCEVSIDKELRLDNYHSKIIAGAKGLYRKIVVKE